MKVKIKFTFYRHGYFNNSDDFYYWDVDYSSIDPKTLVFLYKVDEIRTFESVAVIMHKMLMKYPK